MSRKLTREECLELDIELYNKAIEIQWSMDKVEKNLSGDLSICKYCGRKYVISCICDEAQKDFDNLVNEIQRIPERDRSNEF